MITKINSGVNLPAKTQLKTKSPMNFRGSLVRPIPPQNTKAVKCPSFIKQAIAISTIALGALITQTVKAEDTALPETSKTTSTVSSPEVKSYIKIT